jgi:hypothetical protein
MSQHSLSAVHPTCNESNRKPRKPFGGARMPRGGQVKLELRKEIRKLFKSGETLVSIAERLGKAPSTIAYHVRALGVPAIKHFRALPLTNGKRRCATCGRWKTPNLFPSGANPVCTKCGSEGKAPPAATDLSKSSKHK